MTRSRTVDACTRPCGSCPWRADNDRYRYPNLAQYAADTIPHEPGFGAADPDDDLAALGTMFTCHACEPPRLCAGWLAVVGAEHPLVRLAIISGLLDKEALAAKPDWPPLFASYADMLAAVAADATPPPWDGHER